MQKKKKNWSILILEWSINWSSAWIYIAFAIDCYPEKQFLWREATRLDWWCIDWRFSRWISTLSVYRRKFKQKKFFPTKLNILLFKQKIEIKNDKRDYTINSEMFMNPSPYTVPEISSVPRTFQMFRCLALRHLIVVDSNNRVSGLITRKDFVHSASE